MTAYRNYALAAENFERDMCRAREAGRTDGMDYFIPMCYKLVGPEGRKVRKKVPLLPGYVFVRGCYEEICRYMSLHTYLNFYHPVIKSCEGRMVVPDRQMDDFIRVARECEEDIRYYRPEEIDLQAGDRVRVIGGKLDGVEGVLQTVRGKAGGRVVVSIPSLVAVSSWEIRPDYLEILSFAPGGRRMYGLFDAFFAKARKALADRLETGEASEADRAALSGYVARLRHLQTDTPYAACMLSLLMCMAHTVTGDAGRADGERAKLETARSGWGSEERRAYFATYLYACTGDGRYLEEAKTLTGTGVKTVPTKKRCALAADLSLFERLRTEGKGMH